MVPVGPDDARSTRGIDGVATHLRRDGGSGIRAGRVLHAELGKAAGLHPLVVDALRLQPASLMPWARRSLASPADGVVQASAFDKPHWQLWVDSTC